MLFVRFIKIQTISYDLNNKNVLGVYTYHLYATLITRKPKTSLNSQSYQDIATKVSHSRNTFRVGPGYGVDVRARRRLRRE